MDLQRIVLALSEELEEANDLAYEFYLSWGPAMEV